MRVEKIGQLLQELTQLLININAVESLLAKYYGLSYVVSKYKQRPHSFQFRGNHLLRLCPVSMENFCFQPVPRAPMNKRTNSPLATFTIMGIPFYA
jgi:hypothetical protein